MRAEISNDLHETKVIDSLDGIAIPNWGVELTGAPNIWEHTKGEGIKVAIIDTGVDMNHQDLSSKIKGSVNMLDKTTTDVTDMNGHGTHVAGIIAGEKTGVAPNAELYIANVLNEIGQGTMANILDGITFAINHNVDILCMSLGSNRPLPDIMTSRLKKAHSQGMAIVCATGNNGRQSVEYPAHYDYVIGVGGVNRNLERATFSNYGFDMDVVAPSVDILSTYKDNRYAFMSGTSTASPLVAGGIALIKSYYKKQGVELSPIDIMGMLSNINSKKDRQVGYGIFDIGKMIVV